MRWWWGFVAMALVGGPASSEVFFCDSTKRDTKERYFTPFFQAPYKPGPALSDAFEAFLAASNPGTYDANCLSHDSLSAAKSRLDTFKYNNQDYRWILTDFTGGHPQATDASTVKRPSGAFLTVEDTTPSIRPIDAEVLKAQSEAAGALAKRVADAARNEAAIQAKFKKFMEELRKRGSAQ